MHFGDPEESYLFEKNRTCSHHTRRPSKLHWLESAVPARGLFPINPFLKGPLTCASRMVYFGAQHFRDSRHAHDASQHSLLSDLRL